MTLLPRRAELGVARVLAPMSRVLARRRAARTGVAVAALGMAAAAAVGFTVGAPRWSAGVLVVAALLRVLWRLGQPADTPPNPGALLVAGVAGHGAEALVLAGVAWHCVRLGAPWGAALALVAAAGPLLTAQAVAQADALAGRRMALPGQSERALAFGALALAAGGRALPWVTAGYAGFVVVTLAVVTVTLARALRSAPRARPSAQRDTAPGRATARFTRGEGPS